MHVRIPTRSGLLARIASSTSSFARRVANEAEPDIAPATTLELCTRTAKRLAAPRTSRAPHTRLTNLAHTVIGFAFALEHDTLRRVWPYNIAPVFLRAVVAQRRPTALGAELDVLALVHAIHPFASRAVLETVFRRRRLAVVADPALLARAPEPASRRARLADAGIATHPRPTLSVGTMWPVLAAGASRTPDRLRGVLPGAIR